MKEYQLLVHRRFRFWFLRGWLFVVVHRQSSYRISCHWWGGLFLYTFRFMRYEVGICKVPYD